MAWSEHVWGFCCGLAFPLGRQSGWRGAYVWQIKPTIMENVCGAPDWLHVTWLSSQTTSYAPVATKMPRGPSPPPFKTPHTQFYTNPAAPPPPHGNHLHNIIKYQIPQPQDTISSTPLTSKFHFENEEELNWIYDHWLQARTHMILDSSNKQ